jgi:hypothetical protein
MHDETERINREFGYIHANSYTLAEEISAEKLQIGEAARFLAYLRWLRSTPSPAEIAEIEP